MPERVHYTAFFFVLGLELLGKPWFWDCSVQMIDLKFLLLGVMGNYTVQMINLKFLLLGIMGKCFTNGPQICGVGHA